MVRAWGGSCAGCLGDQSAALLGQRCRQHEAKNTYGTGCFCLLHTGCTPTPSRHGLLTTVARQLGPQVSLSIHMVGILKWGKLNCMLHETCSMVLEACNVRASRPHRR